MLIDDDEMEIDIFQRLLSRSQLTNPLRPFQSGESFLEFLEEVRAGRAPMPALVLVDVRMPTMDGFETVRRVRADQFFSNLPLVIMFSNSDSDRDTDMAKEVGADGFQVKPTGSKDYIAFLDSLAGSA